MAIQSYKTTEGKRYRASFKFQEMRPTRAGFRTITEARAWVADEKRRLAQPVTTNMVFSELCEKYLDWCQGRMQKGTIKQKIYVYKLFLGFLGKDLRVNDVSRLHVSNFIKAQQSQYGSKTANRRLRDINAIFNRAIREGWHDGNPGFGIEYYAEDKFEKYVPSPGDISAVLHVANAEQMDILTAYYHTAGRLSEILNLKWEDVNMDWRWVTLSTRKRKGGQKVSRKLPINDSLFAMLLTRWSNREGDSPYVFVNPRTGNPYRKTNAAINRMMRQLCEKAGVRQFTIHAIRHHVASVIIGSKRASMMQLKDFLGHLRQSTTELYAHDLMSSVSELGVILDESRTARRTQLVSPGSEKAESRPLSSGIPQ